VIITETCDHHASGPRHHSLPARVPCPWVTQQTGTAGEAHTGAKATVAEVEAGSFVSGCFPFLSFPQAEINHKLIGAESQWIFLPFFWLL
jgi:hypothetical protein